MKKNLLNHYVIDLLKSIEQDISICIKDKKPECLHHLRVNIKKINAIFSFSENLYKEKYNTATLKSVYKKAGKIREIQVTIHLSGLFRAPSTELIKQLKRKENILTRQFIEYGPQYARLIRHFSKTVCLPEKLPGKTKIAEYFKKEKQKANKKLKYKDREDLHQYRAKIKRLLYVYNVLPDKIQKEIELNEEEINRQQEKLGAWHDTYSAINYLLNEQFSINTAEYVIKLKEKEKRQFNSLLKNLANNRR
jgi:CHAD domain-containing protein